MNGGWELGVEGRREGKESRERWRGIGLGEKIVSGRGWRGKDGAYGRELG